MGRKFRGHEIRSASIVREIRFENVNQLMEYCSKIQGEKHIMGWTTYEDGVVDAIIASSYNSLPLWVKELPRG